MIYDFTQAAKASKNSENGSAFLPECLSAKYLKPFVSDELRRNLNSAFNV